MVSFQTFDSIIGLFVEVLILRPNKSVNRTNISWPSTLGCILIRCNCCVELVMSCSKILVSPAVTFLIPTGKHQARQEQGRGGRGRRRQPPRPRRQPNTTQHNPTRHHPQRQPLTQEYARIHVTTYLRTKEKRHSIPSLRFSSKDHLLNNHPGWALHLLRECCLQMALVKSPYFVGWLFAAGFESL